MGAAQGAIHDGQRPLYRNKCSCINLDYSINSASPQFSVADGCLYTVLRWADAHKSDLSALKSLMAFNERSALA